MWASPVGKNSPAYYLSALLAPGRKLKIWGGCTPVCCKSRRQKSTPHSLGPFHTGAPCMILHHARIAHACLPGRNALRCSKNTKGGHLCGCHGLTLHHASSCVLAGM